MSNIIDLLKLQNEGNQIIIGDNSKYMACVINGQHDRFTFNRTETKMDSTTILTRSHKRRTRASVVLFLIVFNNFIVVSLKHTLKTKEIE